jgi:hypothetical protein
MDNNRLIVVSETKTDFSLAMQLAFRHHSKAVGWTLWKPKRGEHDKDRPEELLGVANGPYLVLHWCKPDTDKEITKLPAEIDSTLAVDFAWDWLSKQEYGEEPDHDGSNHKGFIVFNESWGHVNGHWSAIVAIGPAWAMAGK